MHELGPARRRCTGTSQGAPRPYQESLANEPVLIAAALTAVYIVLGILYESYIHPITILSTLPRREWGPAGPACVSATS